MRGGDVYVAAPRLWLKRGDDPGYTRLVIRHTRSMLGHALNPADLSGRIRISWKYRSGVIGPSFRTGFTLMHWYTARLQVSWNRILLLAPKDKVNMFGAFRSSSVCSGGLLW
jgi:hypothetical protein